MIIIGEKINGAIPSVKKAIAARDGGYIQELAIKQAEAGADFIDVCAFVDKDELETLRWLIDNVQEVTDRSISIDSPDVRVCVAAMEFCKRPGIINSVSGEGDKIDVVFPLIAGSEWQVMALLCDDSGIPKSASDRIRVLDKIMARADEYGLSHSQIHIDPLIEMLCASENGIEMILEVISYVREKYPKAYVSGGISNISYNLPYRKMVNMAFLVLAMGAGMNSAVLDPLDREIRGAIYATNALNGEDFCCLEYISAFRNGEFGPVQN